MIFPIWRSTLYVTFSYHHVLEKDTSIASFSITVSEMNRNIPYPSFALISTNIIHFCSSLNSGL